MANKKSVQTLSRTDRVRILLKEGKSVKEIAATVGVGLQFVYNVQYHERKKVKASEGARISKVTGKPVRKYKRRAVKTNVEKDSWNERVGEIRRLMQQQQEENQAVLASDLSPIVVPTVPEPYTFAERIRILFTGRL